MRTINGIGRALRAASLSATGCVRISRRDLSGVLYQVNATVDGRLCRVQIMGPAAAVIERFSHHVDSVRARRAAGFLPYPHNHVLFVPTTPQPIVRRKPVRLLTLSAGAATEIMYRMDFATFLFRDAETGVDAVVYRVGDQQVGLMRRSHVSTAGTASRRIVVDSGVAETIPEPAAADRLCRHGLPSLFFVDPATARGRLLYRRFDGHLSLLEACDRT
ncbi:sigma 54 modulation/S30EA ribosomal C-terminal domain-containing protein [Nocardia rhizosphaerae]|uniref:Sigma 54 modulation/S30EA ribosomal C-terminal domain-containing protein n=1 Tax=Nocardia rhizosphaerae TaxID=1691571 RepID=A0ABV8L4K1_9NOCA